MAIIKGNFGKNKKSAMPNTTVLLNIDFKQKKLIGRVIVNNQNNESLFVEGIIPSAQSSKSSRKRKSKKKVVNE